MKRLMTILLAVILGLCVMAGPALAKTWNLRYTSSYPDRHPTIINGILPWFEEIQKVTNDQVKIRNFNPNTICPEGEIYASAVKGAIDMGASNHVRVTGRFPLHEVFSLPLIAGGSEALAETSWRVYEETPALQKEMSETKVLGYWASAPYQIHTVSKPIKTLEDLKGMRILAWSKFTADMLTAWGANPIIISSPESYLALSRAQAEGIMCPLAPFRSLKLNEATKYTVVGNFSGDSWFCVMNKDRWNEFPDDVKAAFSGTLTKDWANRMGRTLDVGGAEDVEMLKKAGHTFYTLPQEERARWSAATSHMEQAWVDKVVKLGLLSEADAKALVKKVRAIGAEATARANSR